jgi:hypothetical protein
MLGKRLKALVIAFVALCLLGVGGKAFIPAAGLADLCPACAVVLGARGLEAYNKFGANDVINTDEESITDMDDLPTAGAGPSRCFEVIAGDTDFLIASSDDEADAGKSITVEIIDGDWALRMATVALGADNGATGTEYVPVVAYLVRRVNRAYATTDAFAGNIYLHKDAADGGTKDGVPDDPPNQTIAVITAGENQTLQSCYTVPLGFSAMISTLRFSNIGNAADKWVTFRIRKRVEWGAPRTQKKFTLQNGDSIQQFHNPPMHFTEKTDIELTGIAEGIGAAVTAEFDIVLVPNQ